MAQEEVLHLESQVRAGTRPCSCPEPRCVAPATGQSSKKGTDSNNLSGQREPKPPPSATLRGQGVHPVGHFGCPSVLRQGRKASQVATGPLVLCPCHGVGLPDSGRIRGVRLSRASHPKT